MYRDMARLIMYGKGSDFSILKNLAQIIEKVDRGSEVESQRESGAGRCMTRCMAFWIYLPNMVLMKICGRVMWHICWRWMKIRSA